MKTLAHILLLTCLWQTANAQRMIDLRGQWKFSAGDDIRWASPEFDDSSWKTIFAPSEWEAEGYPGMDGFGWYRKSVVIAEEMVQEGRLTLNLGRLDDVDYVYFNGYLIGGSGQFPPFYESAFHLVRQYHIPDRYIKVDEPNQIAVRVYDERLSGGMLEGALGIYRDMDGIQPEIDLSGGWRFLIGPGSDRHLPGFNDDSWAELMVPMHWDQQGYPLYDGEGWYRMSFFLPARLSNQDWTLLLGRIDDFDESFVNGIRVGSTGTIPVDGVDDISYYDEYLDDRAYQIPPGILRQGVNTIAVRVYDGGFDGGIYQGPVGLIRTELYQGKKATELPSTWKEFLDFFKIFNEP